MFVSSSAVGRSLHKSDERSRRHFSLSYLFPALSLVALFRVQAKLHLASVHLTLLSLINCKGKDSSTAYGSIKFRQFSNSPINYEPGVWFVCACVPLLKDIRVAPATSSSSSSHPLRPRRSLGCVYGIASPLHAACARVLVCVWRALLLRPPPPSASYLHLLQSLANTHLSLSLSQLVFPLHTYFYPLESFFSFCSSLLMKQSADTHDRGVWEGGEKGQSLVVTLEYWGRW